MKPEIAKEVLIKAIKQTQNDLGQLCPEMTGSTKPGWVLKKYDFDSKIWPSTINLIATELQINIPESEHLFYDKAGEKFLTVDEIVSLLCQFPKVEQESGDEAEQAS